MPEVPQQRPEKRGRKIHPLRDALLAGVCTFIVSAVGLAILYLKARDAQVDAVRIELLQLARATAAQIDGDLLKTLVSPAQQGSPEHLRLLAPLERMHRATHDIYYVYTGVYRDGRIYWVLDGANLYRVPGNQRPPDPIMNLYDVRDDRNRPSQRQEWIGGPLNPGLLNGRDKHDRRLALLFGWHCEEHASTSDEGNGGRDHNHG
jgi:hypothetical protein